MTRENRKGMDRQVENLRIVRKFVFQEPEKVLGRIRLVGKHCASHPGKAHAAGQILVGNLRHRLLQQGQSFLASAGLGEARRLGGGAPGLDGGRLLGNLGEGQGRNGSPKQAAKQNRVVSSKHKAGRRRRPLPHSTTRWSEVELQSKLQLSRILRGIADPEGCSTEAEV